MGGYFAHQLSQRRPFWVAVRLRRDTLRHIRAKGPLLPPGGECCLPRRAPARPSNGPTTGPRPELGWSLPGTHDERVTEDAEEERDGVAERAVDGTSEGTREDTVDARGGRG
jgi:hypothetical protein